MIHQQLFHLIYTTTSIVIPVTREETYITISLLFRLNFQIIISFSVNPVSTNVPLLYPLKTGGIEVEHWLKMG